MSRMLALALVIAAVSASTAQARDAFLGHRGAEASWAWFRYGNVGPGTDVLTLSELRFALEYDGDLLEITGLVPAMALVNFPADSLRVDYEPGRIEVYIGYDTPVPVSNDQDSASWLFEVQGTALDDYYDGERVVVRTVGSAPGLPITWIDDPSHPDDIKVSVENRVIIGNAGITCLAGDALDDGAIDAGDAGTVLRIVTGVIDAPAVMTRCGSDFNRDGNIYAGDAVLILRRAAGFVDPLPRTEVDPRVEFVATDRGARVRIDGAGFAHGATLRVRTVGALSLRAIESNAHALASTRIDEDEAVIALADVSVLTDDVLEFDIEAEGIGRVVVDELRLFGAGGDALFEQAGPLSLELTGPPVVSRVALSNSPNPFNPSTNFRMEVPREGRVVIELFDVKGRKLATLLDEFRPAGASDFRFDGQGLEMSSGVYFARLTTAAGEAVRRVTLLK